MSRARRAMLALAGVLIAASPAAAQEADAKKGQPEEQSAEAPEQPPPQPDAAAGDDVAQERVAPEKQDRSVAKPTPDARSSSRSNSASQDARNADSWDFGPLDGRGLLGNSVIVDLIALVLAIAGGALLGAAGGASLARRRARARYNQLSGRIAAIENGLLTQAKLSRTDGGGGAWATTRAAPYRMDTDEPDFAPSPAPRTPPPARAVPTERAHERTNPLNQAVEEYRRLVAARGSRPRQFAELLGRFPRLLSVRSEAGNIVGGQFREDDANQVLVAAGDGEGFAVLPTYEYVTNFSIAFAKPVMNPEVVRQLFDLIESDSGQLQMESPATVMLDDASVLRIVRKGRLTGFRS